MAEYSVHSKCEAVMSNLNVSVQAANWKRTENRLNYNYCGLVIYTQAS